MAMPSASAQGGTAARGKPALLALARAAAGREAEGFLRSWRLMEVGEGGVWWPELPTARGKSSTCLFRYAIGVDGTACVGNRSMNCVQGTCRCAGEFSPKCGQGGGGSSVLLLPPWFGARRWHPTVGKAPDRRPSSATTAARSVAAKGGASPVAAVPEPPPQPPLFPETVVIAGRAVSSLHLLLLLAAMLTAYLLFKNLSAAHLWDDEAFVSIFARNLLETGQMSAWDGRNLYAYRNGTSLTPDLRTIKSPLDILVTALSFRLFGESTWSARAPHALAGFVATLIFLVALYRDVGRRLALLVYAGGGLVLSVGYLLMLRNCRYYALSTLGTVACYFCYKRVLGGQRGAANWVALALAAVLAFYANFLVGGAILVSLVAAGWLFHRRELLGGALRPLLNAAALFLVLTVPYAIAFRVWRQPDIQKFDKTLLDRIELIWWYFRDLNVFGMLPWMFVPVFAWLCVRFRRSEPLCGTALEWAAIAAVNTFVIALLTPQGTTVLHVAESRYLVSNFPFLAAVAGFVCWMLHRWNRWLAVLVFSIHLSCTAFSMIPFNRVFFFTPWPPQFTPLLPAYLAEIHRPYPTAYAAVLDYLAKHARQDDYVRAVPEYMNYPLMFYAGDRYRFGPLLDRDTPLPMDSLRTLGVPLFVDELHPEWIIHFSMVADRLEESKKLIRTFSKPFQTENGPAQYRYRLADSLPVYWNQTQRPELYAHYFEPPTLTAESKGFGVFISRRTGPFPLTSKDVERWNAEFAAPPATGTPAP